MFSSEGEQFGWSTSTAGINFLAEIFMYFKPLWTDNPPKSYLTFCNFISTGTSLKQGSHFWKKQVVWQDSSMSVTCWTVNTERNPLKIKVPQPKINKNGWKAKAFPQVFKVTVVLIKRKSRESSEFGKELLDPSIWIGGPLRFSVGYLLSPARSLCSCMCLDLKCTRCHSSPTSQLSVSSHLINLSFKDYSRILLQ